MRRWWMVLVALAALATIGIGVGLVVQGLRGPRGDALVLARQAAEALESVTVKGTVHTLTLTPHGAVRTRAEVHRGEGRVHIRYLSGPASDMEVYRQGDLVWARGPRGQLRRQAQLSDGGWHGELLERNWRFRTAGEDVVAERPTIVFTGTGPGGELRVSVDRATGFPLAIERTGPDGRTVSESIWESADFSVAPPPEMEAPPAAEGHEHGHRRRVSPAEARAAVDFELLEPGWLPAGFVHEAWYVHEGRRGTMVESRYTDGLRPLLVIQRRMSAGQEHGERAPRREGRGGPRQRAGGPHGPMMHLRGAGGDAVRRQVGDVTVVVIGPGLVESLERVTDSMRPVGSAQ